MIFYFQVEELPPDAAVQNAYDRVLEVLRHYQDSPGMLERIESRIEKYIVEGLLVCVHNFQDCLPIHI